jgi:hypothetical protein
MAWLLDFRPAHRVRMAQAMKTNETRDPFHVTRLGARRIMPHAHGMANSIQEPRRLRQGQLPQV